MHSYGELKIINGGCVLEMLNLWSFKEGSISFRATLYACYMPCLIQLFFEKFQREIRKFYRNFSKSY